jgi:arabinan endo-1,5-alpha-L-arabinosidase
MAGHTRIPLVGVPVRELPLAEVPIRDPFIVPLAASGEYLLVGSTDQRTGIRASLPANSGFHYYISRDLARWSGPYVAFRPQDARTIDHWAPEVHPWRGRWYLLGSMILPGQLRGTHVLVADHPEGPYRPHSDGAVTPHSDVCLDGTLYVDPQGKPWMVYCHEWVQVVDGRMCAIPLSDDLSRAIGPAIVLFKASDSPWSKPINAEGARVTDGPFLHRTASGELLMLWSSFQGHPAGHGGSYGLYLARSVSGDVRGPWSHDQQPLVVDDGGHGMLLRTFAGELVLSLHVPNANDRERTRLQRVVATSTSLTLGGIYVPSAGGAAAGAR